MQQQIAEHLLNIQAIKLNATQPFTWASGWKSPIYCDNRKALSFPATRTLIAQGLSELVQQNFNEATCIAGVATAGIAWGSLVANNLERSFCYVRPKPKEHGLGNQIEGFINDNDKIVVVEDLISTGKSSLQVVDVLKNQGFDVLGMISIFNYGFKTADDAFEQKNVKLYSLTNYGTLLDVALEKKYILPEQLSTLNQWSKEPSTWGN
jgi:orotate phosphoribosyltransferase